MKSDKDLLSKLEHVAGFYHATKKVNFHITDHFHK